MTYSKNLADRPDSEQIEEVNRRRPRSGLWVIVTSSSVVAHLLLIQWLSVATPPNNDEFEAAMPIDFVDLPDAARSTQSAPSVASAKAKALTASGSMADNSSDKSIESTAEKSQTATDSNSISVASDPEVLTSNAPTEIAKSRRSATPAAGARPRSPSDFDRFDSATSASIQPDSSSPAEAPSLPPSDVSRADTLSDIQSDTAIEATPAPQNLQNQVLVSPSPEPTIITQAIDVPVPDVSGSLPSLNQPAPEQSPALMNQVAVPSQLVASVMAVPLPPEDSKSGLDEIAYPKTETQTFSSNATTSPCPVTPEAVQFLGKTVEMQVTTDAAGQVVQTTTQESSDNSDYDNLATCLIRNWKFAPVIAREETPASDSLIVRITIDRS